MYHHPNTILALHDERQHRLEAEAARAAVIAPLRRSRLTWRRRPQERRAPLPQLSPLSP